MDVVKIVDMQQGYEMWNMQLVMINSTDGTDCKWYIQT